jgi:hypothetical protein
MLPPTETALGSSPAAAVESSPETIVQAALGRNDRYLREFIEALHICPYARGCREAGQLHREVVLDRELDARHVASLITALDGQTHSEIGLLIFPLLTVTAQVFDRFIRDVRARYEAGRTTPIDFFVVAFHPELPQQLKNADMAVRFMRRSPDPTIQLVRPSAIQRARQGTRDPEGLSGHIAEAGLRAVLAAGPERVAALLASLRDGPVPAVSGAAGAGLPGPVAGNPRP